MEKCRTLALTGYGYIQDLNLIGEKPSLRIEVASLSPDADTVAIPDRIIIECTATSERLRKRLDMLDRQHPAIEGVTAWFQVQYLRMINIHPRATPGHSSYRLILSGELLAIEHWLRDGTRSYLK